MIDRQQRYENSLRSLCAALSPKLPGAWEAMSYVEHGEWGLALEMLSDWCIDREPPMTLSAGELETFLEIGESMGLRRPWADLLPLLEPSQVSLLSATTARMAREYLERERPTNPLRVSWLEALRLVVARIETEPR